MDLYQLLYTSFVAPDLDASSLPDIVRRARRKNRELDLTGLLLFDGLCFCHYLEGPSDALYPLLAAIRADRRHFNFRLKEHAPLAGSRRFPSLPLGYAFCPDLDALDRLVKHDLSAGHSAIEHFIALTQPLSIETE